MKSNCFRVKNCCYRRPSRHFDGFCQRVLRSVKFTDYYFLMTIFGEKWVLWKTTGLKSCSSGTIWQSHWLFNILAWVMTGRVLKTSHLSCLPSKTVELSRYARGTPVAAVWPGQGCWMGVLVCWLWSWIPERLEQMWRTTTRIVVVFRSHQLLNKTLGGFKFRHLLRIHTTIQCCVDQPVSPIWGQDW